MTSNPRNYVTSLEAARLLMVSPVTIREWARKGLLPSVSTAGGHRRFLLDQLQQFAQSHGIALESPGNAPLAQPKRVLIVDDDAVFADYLREIITASTTRVSVKCATDGFQAGQLTESFRPQLIALDINMPRMDGIELCRRLRASPTTASSRLIMLSGALSEEKIGAARAAGADAWIEKGASSAEILKIFGLGGAIGNNRGSSRGAGISDTI